MAYKFFRGATVMSGTLTLDEALTASAIISSSANISGSKFYGDGSGLSNVSAGAGGATTQINFNDGGDLAGNAAMVFNKTNAQVTLGTGGETQIATTLGVTGNATFNSNVTLGDATAVTTITGHATASNGLVVNSKGLVAAAGLTVSTLTTGRLPLLSTAGLFADTASMGYDHTRANFDGYERIFVSSSNSGSSVMGDGAIAVFDNAADGGNDIFVVTSGSGLEIGYDADADAAYGAISLAGQCSMQQYKLSGSTILQVQNGNRNLRNIVDIAATTAQFGGIVGVTGTLSAAGNFEVKGDTVLGDAGNENLHISCSAITTVAGATTWRLAESGGLGSNNGALMFWRGSGDDYLKFSTSDQDGQEKGVVFAKPALPTNNDSVDLGSTSYAWRNLYIGNSIGMVGDLTIDGTEASSGGFNLTMKNSLANALDIKQGSDSYLKFNTSTNVVHASQNLVAGDQLTLSGTVAYKSQATIAGTSTIQGVSASYYFVSGTANTTIRLPAVENMEVGTFMMFKRHPNMTKDVTLSCSAADTIDGDSYIELETAGAAVQLLVYQTNAGSTELVVF